MAIYTLPETLGLRIATGAILTQAAFMFLGRVFCSNKLDGEHFGYFQAKYSMGGLSMFSHWSQFFLSLIFYVPVLVTTLALFLSTLMKTRFFGENMVMGFKPVKVLLAIAAVGLLGLFLVPANANRIMFTVEYAPTARSQIENARRQALTQSEPKRWLLEKALEPLSMSQPKMHAVIQAEVENVDLRDGEKFHKVSDLYVRSMELAYDNGNHGYTYGRLTFKFVFWYFFVMCYVFCLLLSFGIIELEGADYDDIEAPNLRHMKTSDFGDTLYADEDSSGVDRSSLVPDELQQTLIPEELSTMFDVKLPEKDTEQEKETKSVSFEVLHEEFQESDDETQPQTQSEIQTDVISI